MSEPADTQYQELHAQIADLKMANGKLTQELANVRTDEKVLRTSHLAQIHNLSAEKQLLHDKYVKVLERLVEALSLIREECDCDD
jgi:hypothetical protein